MELEWIIFMIGYDMIRITTRGCTYSERVLIINPQERQRAHNIGDKKRLMISIAE